MGNHHGANSTNTDATVNTVNINSTDAVTANSIPHEDAKSATPQTFPKSANARTANATANATTNTNATANATAIANASTTAGTTTIATTSQHPVVNRISWKLFRSKRFDFRTLMPPSISAINENETLKLNKRQKQMIVEAWRANNKKGSNDAGIWIFKRIFTDCPELKRLFHLDKISMQHLDDSLRFQRHAHSFTNFFEVLMTSLEASEDNIGPLLYYYGSKHVAFEKRHAFKEEYWDFFGHALNDYAKCWRIAKQRKITLQTWTILIEFLIKKLWEGFELERERTIQREHERYLHPTPR